MHETDSYGRRLQAATVVGFNPPRAAIVNGLILIRAMSNSSLDLRGLSLSLLIVAAIGYADWHSSTAAPRLRSVVSDGSAAIWFVAKTAPRPRASPISHKKAHPPRDRREVLVAPPRKTSRASRHEKGHIRI